MKGFFHRFLWRFRWYRRRLILQQLEPGVNMKRIKAGPKNARLSGLGYKNHETGEVEVVLVDQESSLRLGLEFSERGDLLLFIGDLQGALDSFDQWVGRRGTLAQSAAAD